MQCWYFNVQITQHFYNCYIIYQTKLRGKKWIYAVQFIKKNMKMFMIKI